MWTVTQPMNDLLAYALFSSFFLCFAWGLVRCIPFYTGLTAIHASSRYPALDGLRGFLALGVFLHHSVIVYYQMATGRWEQSPSAFYTLLGHAGFGLFFILTGFLFWQKALRGEPFKALRFYGMRWRRLAPAYFFSMVLIALTVSLPFGEESWARFGWRDVSRILTFKGPDFVNSFSVYWTLGWEWKFYLLLPLMALLARRWWAWLLVVAVIAQIARKPSHMFLFHFVVGALVAEVSVRYPHLLKRLEPLADYGAIAALVGLFALFSTGQGYPQSVLLGLFFLCVVAGGRLFGLLDCRPALLLGTVSYSIYLQHCIVMYVLVRLMDLYQPVGQLTMNQYFMLIPLEAVCVIGLALFSYRYVEHPFMPVRTKLRA